MTVTLAVTSSTAVVGVAVAAGADLLAQIQTETDRRHAEELTPMLAKVLATADRSLSEVEQFAVDVGPGRFTGLRVGLATIRALALATDRPVVPVSSLQLLASQFAGRHSGSVWAVIDARRNEVFQQRFHDGVAVGDPTVGSPESLGALVGNQDIVVGDGADRYPGFYRAGTHLVGQSPSAAVAAALACVMPALPGSEVEPVYLRDADVKINIKTRHNS